MQLPLAVNPVNCYVLHAFTHKLCLFELFFYVFRLRCFHWPTIQPSFSTIYILTDVFFTCVTGLCVYTQWYRSMGAMGAKAPTIFFRGRPPPPPPPPPPTPPPIGCMYWINVLYVLDYLFLSHSTCHIMTYHASCPIFHYMHPFRHSHTHTDTTLTAIPCQSLYTLKL